MLDLGESGAKSDMNSTVVVSHAAIGIIARFLHILPFFLFVISKNVPSGGDYFNGGKLRTIRKLVNRHQTLLLGRVPNNPHLLLQSHHLLGFLHYPLSIRLSYGTLGRLDIMNL